MKDAVNYSFKSVNFSIEAFNGVSHLSQTSMWAEALQVRFVNRAAVPLAIHLAFDVPCDRFQRFHRQCSVIARKGKSSLTSRPDSFCRPAIRNDSGTIL